jgi:chemotaxis protein MotB
MKKLINSFSVILIATTVLLSSCVSKRKYVGSQQQLRSLESTNKRMHNDLNACRADMTACNTNVRSLESERDALKKQNEAIKNQSQATISEQEKRLKSLRALIDAQREATNRLRLSLNEALIGFKPDELSVYIKDGNVYVSLEEKLLFPSGSAVVNPKGKEAIGKLAAVLNKTQDVNVMIEGHTDNVPIKTDKYADNWDLSAARATAIVRVLTVDWGVVPERITAAGRGEFHPVKSNDSDVGRASNRRTEIILSPDLKELYELMMD